jgi:hypothetical protein
MGLSNIISPELRYSENGVGGDIADASSITEREVELFERRLRATGTRMGHRITTNSFRGAIPISPQGCNGYSCLIVSGRLRGSIFGECCDLIGEPETAVAAFWPEGIGVGPLDSWRKRPFSFLDWMDDWLETSLSRFR